jgi:glycine betaine/proline transport system substrate-binding protein
MKKYLPYLTILILLFAACSAPGAAPADTGAAAPAATAETATETESEAESEADSATESEADAPAMAEGEIVMARPTWDTAWFQAAVFEQLLEELGYDVTIAGDLPAETFYPALARGDIDFWTDGWFPLHQNFIDSDVVAGKVEPVGYQVQAGALQGFLVDKATADEHGITSITDFQNPEIAALFDTDDDGKADLTGCDAGWGCEGEVNRILAEHGLEDTVTHVQGTYSLLMADTIARYERGEPIFFYTWTPNWTVSELVLGEDVVWITVPGSEPAPGIPGCVEDPCAMGFVANDIRAVANVEFLEQNPAVRALLEAVVIPLNDIAAQNQLLIEGEDSEEDIARHAQEWIDANRDQVDQWLDAARAAL